MTGKICDTLVNNRLGLLLRNSVNTREALSFITHGVCSVRKRPKGLVALCPENVFPGLTAKNLTAI